MSRTVKWERLGRVAIIQFSNPPINLVNHQFLEDFHQTLDEIEHSNDTRVLVMVSSIEKIFATGRILGSEADIEDGKQRLSRLLQRIVNHPLPTICAVSGAAIGTGFEIALACDLRISSETAKFGFYSDVSPAAISRSCLMELTGPAKAKELIWFGQLIDAPEAIRIGIVNRLFTESHLLNEAIEMVNSIVQQAKVKVEL